MWENLTLGPDFGAGSARQARFFDHFADRPVDAVRAVDACRGRLVYLATPYSKRAVDAAGAYCPAGAREAARGAVAWSARLAEDGITAISPIVLSQAMADTFPSAIDPLDADFWNRWCAPLLMRCQAVIVPPMAGWRESAGVRHEVATAAGLGLPVYVIEGAQHGQV